MKPAPIIDIDLGENGGREVFTSQADVQTWINKEVEFWSWLSGASDTSPLFPQISSHFNGMFSSIQQAISQLPEPSSVNFLPQANQIRDQLINFYSGKKILHSTTVKARFLSDLRQEQPVVAGYACAYFINHPQLFSGSYTLSLSAHRGIFEANLFEKGIKGNVKNERKALEDLKIEFQNTIVNFTTEINKIQNEHEKALTELEELKAGQTSQFAGIISNSEEKLSNKFSETEIDLQNITKTYDEKLALEAPVRYWKNKRKNHTAAKKNLFIWLIVFVFASLTLLFSGYHALLANFEPGNTPDYWRLGVAITFLSTVFWIARILVRIYLSHLHLEEDAFQRITMIQTFLSLMRRGKLPKDEDMNLILAALFRPNGDGLVKDEGVPSAMFDLIKRGERQ